jgi:GMP synthase (glutamine-hydrolysing)
MPFSGAKAAAKNWNTLPQRKHSMADTDKRAVIIKAGTKIASLASTAGDYEDWISDGFNNTFSAVDTVDVVNGAPLPPLDEVAAIAITGSGAMLTEKAPWMEKAASWLREAVQAGIPVLGICFGHQLLAYSLGGEVGDNPRGLEVGTATIHLTDAAASDPLFGELPLQFPAQLTHMQSVLRLPPGAHHLASSEKDPHQAFSYGRCTWGVQFHPEFDENIIRHFIEYYREQSALEGDCADRLPGETVASPESKSLLRKFALLAKACSEA